MTNENSLIITSTETTDKITAVKTKHNITLRQPKHGEWGWIIYNQATTYWNEFEFGYGCELLIGQVVIDMMRKTKAGGGRFRVYIATVDDEPLGSIVIDEESKDSETARIKLFCVSPGGRGFGLGSKLMSECIEFAKNNGFKKVVLRTASVLSDARKLYDKFGFKFVGPIEHVDFDKILEGQVLQLDL